MFYSLTGEDHQKEWTIQCILPATIEHPLLPLVLDAARNLNDLVPIRTIDWRLTATPKEYDFIIVDKNGRRWSQLITMDAVADPKMIWRHQSAWRRTELVLVDQLRLRLFDITQSIQPTEMNIKFE